MKIRVIGKGWDSHVAAHVRALCLKYSLPFIDRCAVADGQLGDTVFITETPDLELPEGYVFFQHTGMTDLPCTHNSTVVYPVESAAQEAPLAPKSPEGPSRKVVEGTKRVRAEWKEAQAKCKTAKSFNEWLTFLYDLLTLPRYSVAKALPPDAKGKVSYSWHKSLDRAFFVYPTQTLEAMPKCVVEDLENYLAAIRLTGRSSPHVFATEKPLNGRKRAVVIDHTLVEDTHGDGENDMLLLTIKPTTINLSLY